MTRPFRFFLGGHDLEMLTIAALVRAQLGSAAVVDKGLRWGAQADAYAAEIDAWRAAGGTAVLVELPAPGFVGEDVVEVDHHGARTADPSALRQVFSLLGLPAESWTRHFSLVEANDIGHVAAMRAIGATAAEMATIRAADRAAQGITEAEEMAGRDALAAARFALDGRLMVVDLPHGRTATAMDPLALEQERALQDVLILTPGGPHFFGSGGAVAALDDAFPGGWRGGHLPQRGFWGVQGAVDEAALLGVIAQAYRG